MKVDQCQHCTVRGDFDACKVTPCNQHESWYAVTMQAKIAALKIMADLELDGFVTRENFRRHNIDYRRWTTPASGPHAANATPLPGYKNEQAVGNHGQQLAIWQLP